MIKWITLLGIMIIYYMISFYIPGFGEPQWEIIPGMSSRWLCCLLYCVALFIFMASVETFQIGERRILDILFGFFFSSVIVNLAVTIVKVISGAYRIDELIALFVLAILVQDVIGFIWVMFCHRIYERFQFRREAIFIYGKREDETEYIRVNNTINKFFRISQALDFSVGTEKIIREIQISSVVFLGDIPVDIRNTLIKYCMNQKIECYSIPKISDIYIQNSKILQLHDKLLLRYPQLGIYGRKRVAKRLMDILLSLLMLAIFSPAMFVIAVAIKKDDGGQVFFYQDRVTQDGRPFKMCKFRSMRADAEAEGIRLAAKDDVRVTRVGNVIRNIHFDELPQLINVLKGEMSLVGPRPERREFIEAYSQRIPEFAERLKVKGGLTGYAQVYGRYNSEPEDKIKYDLYYIYNYSIWLDIKILILTIRILFQRENTEGIDEDQINAMKQKK